MPSTVSFRLTGVEAMTGKLTRVAKLQRARFAASILSAARDILTDSQDHYVPVDKGDLSASGYVDPLFGNSTTASDLIAVSIGYAPPGTPEAAYALAVHEHPSRYSPPSWRNVRDRKTGQFRRVQFHPSGHGPKYLELPLRAAAGRLLNELGAHARF